MAAPRRALTVVDRTTIALRLEDGWGIRRIARGLCRSVGTIPDEVNRNGGPAGSEACAATDQAAHDGAQAPDGLQTGALFAQVSRLVGLGWSPEQISGRRKREEAGMERPLGLRVSHGAIYAAIYALPRGRVVAGTGGLPAPRQGHARP